MDSKLLELYQSGLSTRQIAAEIGRSQGYVYTHLKRQGCKFRKNRESMRVRMAGGIVPEGLKRAFCELYESNHSCGEISEIFGFSVHFVWKILKEEGVRLRSTEEAKSLARAKGRLRDRAYDARKAELINLLLEAS